MIPFPIFILHPLVSPIFPSFCTHSSVMHHRYCTFWNSNLPKVTLINPWIRNPCNVQYLSLLDRYRNQRWHCPFLPLLQYFLTTESDRNLFRDLLNSSVLPFPSVPFPSILYSSLTFSPIHFGWLLGSVTISLPLLTLVTISLSYVAPTFPILPVSTMSIRNILYLIEWFLYYSVP